MFPRIQWNMPSVSDFERNNSCRVWVLLVDVLYSECRCRYVYQFTCYLHSAQLPACQKVELDRYYPSTAVQHIHYIERNENTRRSFACAWFSVFCVGRYSTYTTYVYRTYTYIVALYTIGSSNFCRVGRYIYVWNAYFTIQNIYMRRVRSTHIRVCTIIHVLYVLCV